MGLKIEMEIQNRENTSQTCNPDDGLVCCSFIVPEGTVVSIIQVFSLLTFVLSRAVSHTQTAQAAREPGLVGTWHTALLEELSHR